MSRMALISPHVSSISCTPRTPSAAAAAFLSFAVLEKTMTSSASITSSRPAIDGTRLQGRQSRDWIAGRCFALVLWAMGFWLCHGRHRPRDALARAGPALHKAGPGAFLLSSEWRPTERDFGALAMVAGTFAVSLGALAIAGPVAVMCALQAALLSHTALGWRFGACFSFWRGIPSVVYGLWG